MRNERRIRKCRPLINYRNTHVHLNVYVTAYDVDGVRVWVLPLVISVWACEDAEGGRCGGEG